MEERKHNNYFMDGELKTEEQIRQEYIDDCTLFGIELKEDNFKLWLYQNIIEGYIAPDEPNFDIDKYEKEHHEEIIALEDNYFSRR